MPLVAGRPREFRDPRHNQDFYSGPRNAEMPDLTKVYSASSSSTPSTGGSFRKSNPNLRTGSSQSDSMGRSSDNHILRGAEILRNQILEGTFHDDKEIMYLHHRASESQEGPYRDGADFVETYEEADDDSDWSDPFPPPEQETMRVHSTQNGSAAWKIPFTKYSHNPSQSALPAADDAKHWAHYLSDTSESEDGEYVEATQTEDENTTAVLARATNILGHASENSVPHLARVSPETSPRDYHVQQQDAPSKEYLVPRVHEMETSTFDSSSVSTRLFPDLNCELFVPKSFLDINAPCDMQRQPERQKQQQQQPPAPPKAYRTSNANAAKTPDSMDLLNDLQENEEVLFCRAQQEQPTHDQSAQPVVKGRDSNMPVKSPAEDDHDPCNHIVPPSSQKYLQLLRDPGFLHAQRAGVVWQSIVSQHVRFPVAWWNGFRNPPLGVGTLRLWTYLGRHRVRENPFLQYKVRNRGSAGRLLLHIVVRDIMTGRPTLDMAVGCFHPNARGIRTTFAFDPYLEDCRDIWLAIRRRSDEVSVMESMLQHGREPESSPLGSRNAIENENLRAVFGETPPIHTILVLESELYELFSRRLDGTVPAAALLLEQYVAEW